MLECDENTVSTANGAPPEDRPALHVSVVVPVLNRERMIGDAIRAILDQSGLKGGFEVVVVDNGSSDGTRDVVGGFLSDARVRLLFESRRGAAAARNRALRRARGEIIACADSDTLPSRRWLAELVRPFESPEVIQTGGRIVAYSPETPEERFISMRQTFDQSWQIDGARFQNAIGMNTAIRRSAALAVGGWDPEFRPAGEDTDLSHRLRLRFGRPIVYCPGAVVFHRHRAELPSLKRQAYGYGKGAAKLYKKFPSETPPIPVAIAGLASHCASLTWLDARARALGALGKNEEDERLVGRLERVWNWSFTAGFAAEAFGWGPS